MPQYQIRDGLHIVNLGINVISFINELVWLSLCKTKLPNNLGTNQYVAKPLFLLFMHSEKVIQKNEMGEEIQINIHVASHRCCPPHLRCTEPEPGLPCNLTHIKPSISGEYECLQDIISDTVFFEDYTFATFFWKINFNSYYGH